MPMSLEHADSAQLAALFDAVAVDVAQIFGPMTPPQLNWKPSADAWSIGQCLDHLLVANRTYLPTINALLTGTHQRTFWERLPLLPSIFGPQLVRSLHPATARPTRAPSIFVPSDGPFDRTIVPTFARQQHDLAALVHQSARTACLNTVIASPVAPFITYRLLDAYRIIATHEQLHVAQARQVMQQAHFPAAAPADHSTH